MVIDVHTHVWPDRIAKVAMGGRSHGLEARGDGTISGLSASMRESGVDRSVIFGISEKAETVDRVHEFVGAQDPDLFIPFGSVHVGLSPQENLASLRRYGMRGVKINTLFQNFRLDDPRLLAILSALGAELPVIVHVGEGGDAEANSRCTISMVVDLARKLPDLRLIACHLGGYRQIDLAEAEVIGLPVFLDTSWPPSLGALDPARVRALIERHGPERVIFGSDWPMADPATEVAAVHALGLAEAHERAVLGGNLARLLGIDGDT
jgi:predicted TIM-barrel fold metal-dependent hydrolase